MIDFYQEEIAIPTLTEISLHGAVLMQKLLQFGNPKPLVSSLLDMKGTSLRNLACNPHGSFVYDVIVKSATIGEKSHESFLAKLKVDKRDKI